MDSRKVNREVSKFRSPVYRDAFAKLQRTETSQTNPFGLKIVKKLVDAILIGKHQVKVRGEIVVALGLAVANHLSLSEHRFKRTKIFLRAKKHEAGWGGREGRVVSRLALLPRPPLSP